ncbi:hypothetical protein GGG87_07895 [Streptococcus sp. zg-86]|uniref:Uncharacterized protein n=2 Tax=Streptococcus TaxID=1301 RepID=A0A6I4RBX4_9STRE|nr:MULTISPECIES: hypothetical protein [unclassified Streptococcus]MTB64916.1 hypothetical protein [Streptococcus sp. zg-86]MTB91130.1 hypothetical protein [Streptococcus sp. zg-36]MWV56999.1 hypothetical protein [Streptococcus sp. zg-70]
MMTKQVKILAVVVATTVLQVLFGLVMKVSLRQMLGVLACTLLLNGLNAWADIRSTSSEGKPAEQSLTVGQFMKKTWFFQLIMIGIFIWNLLNQSSPFNPFFHLAILLLCYTIGFIKVMKG